METLLLPFSPRFIILTICAVVTALFVAEVIFDPEWFDFLLIPILIFGGLSRCSAFATSCRRATRCCATIRSRRISASCSKRSAPRCGSISSRARRTACRSRRDIRAVVYQRAKMELDKRPFGTQEDVYHEGYEWMHHSVAPKTSPSEKFRVTIGGPDCAKPYSASVFNISAMSFGSLSPNAMRSLNAGAKKGELCPRHRRGRRQPLSPRERRRHHLGDRLRLFRLPQSRRHASIRNCSPSVAGEDQIKMVELKISQGAKPGHGGVLPAAKVSAEISRIRGVEMGEDCISPARHSAFSTPIEMMKFIGELRRLSGGKPAGFKMCIGHPWEFLAICKAMLETGIYPDFIVVDGNEGGTGAAPLEFMDHLGMPMREGVNFVHNALIGINARDRIKIGASGKIATAFDMARAMAIGADWCNSARGFMFALGCIQSLSCHTDRCPTGVATQDPTRNRALVVPHKTERVYNYHHATLHALAELLAAAGLEHPRELRPIHFSQRIVDHRGPLVRKALSGAAAR